MLHVVIKAKTGTLNFTVPVCPCTIGTDRSSECIVYPSYPGDGVFDVSVLLHESA
jgi:hypothetical protein